MLSQMLTEILRDLLKETFPKFAYWLYYSEVTVTLLIGILCCFDWPFGTLFAFLFFFYAAFCWTGACNYGRKKALEKKIQWKPSHLDRAVAFFLSAGLILVGIGFILLRTDIGGFIIIFGVGFIVLGVYNLFILFSGKWITFPG